MCKKKLERDGKAKAPGFPCMTFYCCGVFVLCRNRGGGGGGGKNEDTTGEEEGGGRRRLVFELLKTVVVFPYLRGLLLFCLFVGEFCFLESRVQVWHHNKTYGCTSIFP